MSTGLEVSGGVGGLAVHLADLEDSAASLRAIAERLGESALDIGLTAADPRLAVAGLLAPVEFVALEAAILDCAGPRGVGGAAAEVLATAVATSAAVTAYRRGEDAAESLSDGIATGIGAWAGGAAAPVAITLAAATPTATVALEVPGARDAVVSVGLGLGRGMDEVLFDHPWLVPAAADGLDGVVLGLGGGVPALGAWLGWRSGRFGVPYPPRTQADALGVILAVTHGAALDESDHEVAIRPRAAASGIPPRSVADLIAEDGPTSGADGVRITGIPAADGTWTWVVDIPGTQTFTPAAGATPWDLTSNVLLLAGHQTLTTKGVSCALEDAQRRVGATGPGRVMLTGHSQGGMTAAALAADPGFRERFGVTHVVTSGAPIARLDVPEEVLVLSLEHREDLVPGLEGAENPDRATRVTVRRTLADEFGADGRASRAHHVGRYVDTARLVDASDDPSLTAWREGAAPFLGGGAAEAVTIDYDIERVPR